MTPAWAQRQEELLKDCTVSPDVFGHMVDRISGWTTGLFPVCCLLFVWLLVDGTRFNVRGSILVRKPGIGSSSALSAQ